MSHSEVEFAITPTIVDGCRVFVLEGELDAAQTPTLTEALDHGTDGLPVIVDLTALTFLDSSGIHALLRDGEGGKPAALVRAPASNVGRVLDIVDQRRRSRSTTTCLRPPEPSARAHDLARTGFGSP